MELPPRFLACGASILAFWHTLQKGFLGRCVNLCSKLPACSLSWAVRFSSLGTASASLSLSGSGSGSSAGLLKIVTERTGGSGSFATRLSNVLMSTSFSISTHFLLKTHVVRMTCFGYLVAGVLKVLGKCPTIICGKEGCETQPAFVRKSEPIFSGMASLIALRILGSRPLSGDSTSASLSTAPASLVRPLKDENPQRLGRQVYEPSSRPWQVWLESHHQSRALSPGACSRVSYLLV